MTIIVIVMVAGVLVMPFRIAVPVSTISIVMPVVTIFPGSVVTVIGGAVVTRRTIAAIAHA